MNNGKACAIALSRLDDDEISEDKKIEAIRVMANMKTHNGVPKSELLNVIKFLLSAIAERDKEDEIN